jgi:hypothetical protein
VDVEDGHFCESLKGQVFEIEKLVVNTASLDKFHVIVEPVSDHVTVPADFVIAPVMVFGSIVIPEVGLNFFPFVVFALRLQLFASVNDMFIPSCNPFPPTITVAAPVTVPFEARSAVTELMLKPGARFTFVRVALAEPPDVLKLSSFSRPV